MMKNIVKDITIDFLKVEEESQQKIAKEQRQFKEKDKQEESNEN